MTEFDDTPDADVRAPEISNTLRPIPLVAIGGDYGEDEPDSSDIEEVAETLTAAKVIAEPDIAPEIGASALSAAGPQEGEDDGNADFAGPDGLPDDEPTPDTPPVGDANLGPPNIPPETTQGAAYEPGGERLPADPGLDQFDDRRPPKLERQLATELHLGTIQEVLNEHADYVDVMGPEEDSGLEYLDLETPAPNGTGRLFMTVADSGYAHVRGEHSNRLFVLLLRSTRTPKTKCTGKNWTLQRSWPDFRSQAWYPNAS